MPPAKISTASIKEEEEEGPYNRELEATKDASPAERQAIEQAE